METVVRRLLQTIPVLVGISIIVFSLMHLTPGDPLEIMFAGAGHISQADIQLMRSELGLDQPLVRQYVNFVCGLFKGDWGMSIRTKAPVKNLLLERLPATLELTAAAMVVSLLIALPTGILSATRQHSTIDKLGTLLALLGISLPDFWLGLSLILVFAVGLNWLPGGVRLGFDIPHPPTVTGFFLIDSLLARNWAAFWGTLKHLALPAAALGAPLAALTMRVTRSSMLEALSQDYITFARSKGLRQRMVVLKHALRNALIPTVTVFALNIGSLLGGNMIIERIFSWPGLGQLVVDSIRTHDYPVVQAAVLLYALTYVIVNLLADLAYIYLNPKIRL